MTLTRPVYVGGWLPVSRELIADDEPFIGPPDPPWHALRRRLGGRPAGPYRRAGP